jgi:hypothetical protein
VVRDWALIFDEVMPGGTSMTTSDDHAERLGAFDKIALQAVVDQTTGTGNGTLTVALYHSCDGEAWEARAGTPEINGQAITLNAITPFYGGVTDSLPTLALVRAKVSIAGGSLTSARVRLYAVMRDVAD